MSKLNPTTSINQLPRLIIAITGASGAIIGVELLKQIRTLKQQGLTIETHLIVSPSGWLTIGHELSINKAELENLADVNHSAKSVGACIASGSYQTLGMVIAPCSMRTLGAVAHGLADNLITRAADVTLKERRRLIIVPRETPLNLAHLRNMTSITEMGGIIFPPAPAFYQNPTSIDDMVQHMVRHIVNLLGIQLNNTSPINNEWQGI